MIETRFVVATAHDMGYAEIATIGTPSVRAYCERHGYQRFYLQDRPAIEGDFCKVAMFQQLYHGMTRSDGHDWVCVWIDADAIVMNSDVRLETIVYQHMPRNIHFLIGTDPNGLNSGVFFARFTPEAYRYLTAATTQSRGMGWADQEGMIQTALKYPYTDICKFIPGKAFNCFDYSALGWEEAFPDGNYVNRYEPGDFVLHAAGLAMEQFDDAGNLIARPKIDLLRRYAELAR